MDDEPAAAPTGTDIRLTLPARAENVALVRHVIGALAEAIGAGEPLIEDVKLAVTEACTNVIRHAYRGTEGPIDVSVTPDGDRLTVVVRDRGQGIDVPSSEPGPGFGLPLMAALAEDLEVRPGPDGDGSLVRMSFRLAGDTLEPV